MIISAKYRRKTLHGLEPSFMCDASLSFFPLGPPVYVCTILLCGREGRVHRRVTACWVRSPGPLSTASFSSEALDEIELQDSQQLALWQYHWGCDTLGTFSEPPSTELKSLKPSLHHYLCQQPVQILCLVHSVCHPSHQLWIAYWVE